MANIKIEPSASEPMISRYIHTKCAAAGIPASATFELTSGCNFNCKMCYIHSPDCKQGGNELSAAEWISLGNQARELGVIFLLLTGGEPLVRKDFPEIYTALKKMGFIISINTNGSLLCGEIEELFKNNPPSRLNVSLYGADNETYRRLCGAPQFDRVIENIRRMRDIGIDVKINCSITPDNCGDLEKIYELAKSLGLHIKLTTYMYPSVRQNPVNTGFNAGRLSPRDAAYYRVKYSLLNLGEDEFLRRSENLNALFDTEDECVDIDADRGVRCRAGRSALWIDRLGNVYPCGMITGEDCNAVEKGLAECWKTVRAKTSCIKTPLKCTACKYRSLCPACAAACKCETGSFETPPDYLCEMSRYTVEFIAEKSEEIRRERNDGK